MSLPYADWFGPCLCSAPSSCLHTKNKPWLGVLFAAAFSVACTASSDADVDWAGGDVRDTPSDLLETGPVGDTLKEALENEGQVEVDELSDTDDLREARGIETEGRIKVDELSDTDEVRDARGIELGVPRPADVETKEGVAWQPSPLPQTLCAWFYKDIMDGDVLLMQPGETIGNLKDIGWNDQITSYGVTKGCDVDHYRHANFVEPLGGYSLPVDSPYDHVTVRFTDQYAKNSDQISSIRCTCDWTVHNNVAGYLYEHPNFRGTVHPVGTTVTIDLGSHFRFNDQLSSLVVMPSNIVTTWVHGGKGGTAHRYVGPSRITQVEDNDSASVVESEGGCRPRHACFSSRGCVGKVLSNRDGHNCKVKTGGKSYCSTEGICYDGSDMIGKN